MTVSDDQTSSFNMQRTHSVIDASVEEQHAKRIKVVHDETEGAPGDGEEVPDDKTDAEEPVAAVECVACEDEKTSNSQRLMRKHECEKGDLVREADAIAAAGEAQDDDSQATVPYEQEEEEDDEDE